MYCPRASRSPALLGPDWRPVFAGRFIQRTRRSPIARTTVSESSVQPSPITSSSRFANVCASTLAIEYGSTLLQL